MSGAVVITSLSAAAVIGFFVSGDTGGALAMIAPLWVGVLTLGVMWWKKGMR